MQNKQILLLNEKRISFSYFFELLKRFFSNQIPQFKYTEGYDSNSSEI